MFFINFNIFLIKTGYSLIGLVVGFPIQSSEFIKPLNFGSNMIKKLRKKPKFFKLYFKLIYVNKKICLKF